MRPPSSSASSALDALPAIVVLGVSRRFARRWALVDVSLQLPAGRALMIAGRNGAGKSTLLRVLATAIRPDRGTARVLGLDAQRDREDVRRATSLLAHDSHHYEALTALDNLRIAARFLGRDASREALRAALAEVDLVERADDAVTNFSAGMRRRLSLARMLLKDARVVLLDEPYAALDPPGFRLVDRLLERLRARGRTVLMATHLVEHGRALCDDAIVLESGRLALACRVCDLPADVARLTSDGREVQP